MEPKLPSLVQKHTEAGMQRMRERGKGVGEGNGAHMSISQLGTEDPGKRPNFNSGWNVKVWIISSFEIPYGVNW